MVNKLLILLIFSFFCISGCAKLSHFYESEERESYHSYHQGYADGFENGCSRCQGKSEEEASSISFFEKDDDTGETIFEKKYDHKK